MPDWIEEFVETTKGVPSPEIFRLWTAISTVAGVLERKTWTSGTARPIFPNQYILLVGPPGSGKTNAIWKGRELWRMTKDMKVAPDNVTKASLLDALENGLRSTMINGEIFAFTTIAVAASEFGVFVTKHDLEFLSVLNEIYEGPQRFEDDKRTTKSVDLLKPNVNMIAGTQPDFLGSMMPEEAWGMGFASRLVMVYGPEAPPVDIIGSSSSHDIRHLQHDLQRMFELVGEFQWAPEAALALNNWNKSGRAPEPQHQRLRHYNARRAIHIVKLAMASAASRTKELYVAMEDFERAKNWLMAAEEHMPDIFNAMQQKSDALLISEMHLSMFNLYTTNKRKPITTSMLHIFLSSKVPSERIRHIIDLAEKMGVLQQGVYVDEWIVNEPE